MSMRCVALRAWCCRCAQLVPPLALCPAASQRALRLTVRATSGEATSDGAPVVVATAAAATTPGARSFVTAQDVLVTPRRAAAETTRRSEADAAAGQTRNHGAASAAKEGYAPWEVRALVLALLPPDHAGVEGMTVKEVLYLLPRAVRQQLIEYDGGLIAYARDHFADDVVLGGGGEGGGTLRRKVHIGSGFYNTPCDLPAAPSNTSPPPLASAPATASTIVHTALHTTQLDILNSFIEYIPTFFVNVDAVAATMPEELRRTYSHTKLSYFLRRFKNYLDLRARNGVVEVRLRRDLAHPKRGYADHLHSTLHPHKGHDAGGPQYSAPLHSEANLIAFLIPQLPKSFAATAEVLREVSDAVAHHPAFDPRLGVMGLLEKYPEYIQIVDGRLRVRPYRVAPNALDELNATSSPLPAIFAKVLAEVEAAAKEKDYSIADEKAAAAVPTGRLYALLTTTERELVKTTCRSFPRFLRLHGELLVVSQDKMRVYRFQPPFEPCAETLLSQSLQAHALSPDDPVLKIPAAIDPDVKADWAVQELYDALPLTQCAELEDVLTLVPTSVRQALPASLPALRDLLARYPDYFLTWPYPDDPAVIVIQRAKLEVPAFEKGEIARLVRPYIPQGGTELGTLLRRLPLALQRYLYHHGLRKTLHELDDFFRISGERVICIRQ